ncbi:MAG: low-specificity L-threonine aldolase [Armatimonadetes bacterium]|nr:low-specificity L-threonine aldolase [Armatimonadota bacterium]MDE2207652.1 low-specificity L-threonine aldolase [Armatimonadota bacterium]
MHTPVDLRSDTTTRPSASMRAAMAAAEVGDDVFDDDPTIHRLQEQAATRFGKEAALLMPSGTMSNCVAVKTHTTPGDEILLDAAAHSMLYEVGMPAVIANVLTRQFPSERGVPDVPFIAANIQTESIHAPGTRLIVLENTHNRAGGAIIPMETHREIWEIANERGLMLHIDGARILNAAVATGTEPREYGACCHSITFCLSKGLGCPVGSVLCGSREFIGRARRVRKLLGGGMRQAGILAAAGIYALENHVDRLADDHRRAAALAMAIRGARNLGLDDRPPPTNMVYVRTAGSAAAFCAAMREAGVLAAPTAADRFRLVTHLDIDDDDVEFAANAICRVAAAA